MFDSSVRQDQDSLPVLQHGGLGAVESLLEHQLPSSKMTRARTENDLALTLAPGPVSDVSDQETDTSESKKKTLSTSSISSASSTSSSVSMTASSTSTSSPPTSSHLAQTEVNSLSSSAGPSQHGDDPFGPQIAVQQEDIKEVQIETEDPSHLFWVPFHMHPEIAPNEYNKWLSKHGVDSTNDSGILSSRNGSINRRKSVLSAQYNPEDDDEEDEDENEEEKEKGKNPEHPDGHAPEPETAAEHEKKQDFLSGTFYTPLEDMGAPPLKTSVRRSSTSHIQHWPQSHEKTDGDVASDMVVEDLATVKRGGGLIRHGPSFLRRSARTKIRRNSTASNDARNDTSRLRSAPIENGEYPAVTLVDSGPMPLPFSPLSLSTLSESSPSSFDESEDDSMVQKDVDHKPSKSFVSTLRDSSKPTITTYVEPQLLEQRQKELKGISRMSGSMPTATPASNLDTPSHTANGGLASTVPSTQVTLGSGVVSKLTYPIPPPVKLSQNLLQQPKVPGFRSQVPPKHASLSTQSAPPQKQMIAVQNLSSPANAPQLQPYSKKSSSWSWLWGKEKGGDKATGMAQREPQAPLSASPSQPPFNNSSTPNEVVGKKQSTLSLLFSRNGKSSKAQLTSAESGAPSSFGSTGRMSMQGDHLYDRSRMPIHIERAIYRLSHVKLANPRRPLHEQVLISNMMFWYLGVIQQQQLQQQQGQQQQRPARQSSEYVHPGTGEPAEFSLASTNDETLKKSHHDGLSTVAETKVEGSELVVPQQDSNSHARSPGKEVVIILEIVHNQSSLHTHNRPLPSPHEQEYDEESMIGGQFSGNSSWLDENDYGDDMDAMERGGCERTGAGSPYLQSGNQASNGYKIHAMQTSGAC